jgi:hypothetical protein
MASSVDFVNEPFGRFTTVHAYLHSHPKMIFDLIPKLND